MALYTSKPETDVPIRLPYHPVRVKYYGGAVIYFRQAGSDDFRLLLYANPRCTTRWSGGLRVLSGPATI
mgnify:CR=1 FL=1